jgi:hypothetical protein
LNQALASSRQPERRANLKPVQRALNHSDIKSTLRHVHGLDDEVAEAMERVARDRRLGQSPDTDFRKKVPKCLTEIG